MAARTPWWVHSVTRLGPAFAMRQLRLLGDSLLWRVCPWLERDESGRIERSHGTSEFGRRWARIPKQDQGPGFRHRFACEHRAARCLRGRPDRANQSPSKLACYARRRVAARGGRDWVGSAGRCSTLGALIEKPPTGAGSGMWDAGEVEQFCVDNRRGARDLTDGAHSQIETKVLFRAFWHSGNLACTRRGDLCLHGGRHPEG